MTRIAHTHPREYILHAVRMSRSRLVSSIARHSRPPVAESDRASDSHESVVKIGRRLLCLSKYRRACVEDPETCGLEVRAAPSAGPPRLGRSAAANTRRVPKLEHSLELG
jgi:hypothetical protein